MTAMTNPQVMDYARNVAQTAQQNLQTQMSDLDKALVMDQGGINVGDRQALARLMEQVPGLMGATAYHGTPHTIRGKFDISKVGTGEGGQAYGHGMYFAENPEVAKTYANLGTGNVAYRGHTEDVLNKLQKSGLDKETADLVSTFVYEGGFKGGTAQDLAAFLKTYADNPNQEKIFTNLTKKPKVVEAINSYVSPKQPNLYKVDIPDEYIPNMVQWETPLSKMDEKLSTVINSLQEQFKNQFNPNSKPRKLLKEAQSVGDVIRLANEIGLKPHISLQEMGYKGIKYLDQGSRGVGKGTSNFVVFDPTDVKILEKNSQKVEGLLD
jgi:hypothetical protein